MGAPDKIDDIPVTPSSGNVFADLGFPNAEEEPFRADLLRQIIRAMELRGLTQARMAKILGVSPSNITHLVHRHDEDFSIHQLLRFLEFEAPARDRSVARQHDPPTQDA